MVVKIVRNGTDAFELPKAGDILVYDYRPKASKMLDSKYKRTHESSDNGPTLKCIQWNIERGYELNQIITTLKSHHADILCLQELDIGCERSEGRDCAREISQALCMKCAFYVEFEEKHSPLRSRKTQGGGVHGNAILSRWNLEPRIIDHSHQPIEWEKEGIRLKEPRQGKRAVLAADVNVPGMDAPLLCYSLHLEVFCGIFGRVKQMVDVLQDARNQSRDRPWQLIFGDLNTMAHGIARLSPTYCGNGMRTKSIGYSEAAWWHQHLLMHTDSSCEASEPSINPALAQFIPKHISEEEAVQLKNPHFYDPFSIAKDTTLEGYRGLYRGKLDWTLLRGWHVLAKGMDNHHFRWSDHKLLYVIIKPVPRRTQGEDSDPGVVAFRENYVPLAPRHRRNQLFWNVGVSCLILAVILVGSFELLSLIL